MIDARSTFETLEQKATMSDNQLTGYYRVMTTVSLIEHALCTCNADYIAKTLFDTNVTLTVEKAEQLIKDSLEVKRLAALIEDDEEFSRNEVVSRSMEDIFVIALSLVTLDEEEALAIFDAPATH